MSAKFDRIILPVQTGHIFVVLAAVVFNADMSLYVITIFSRIHDTVHHNIYVRKFWHMHVGLFLPVNCIHSYGSLLVDSLFLYFF